MNDLNINRGSDGSIYFDGTQDTTEVQTKQSKLAQFTDGQSQAVDVSLLSLGGDKIPIIPILPPDPKGTATNYLSQATTTPSYVSSTSLQVVDQTVKDSKTTVAVASDGSIVTKGSGATSNAGFVDPTQFSDVAKAASTVASSSGDISLMNFMKIIQDAIQKLQNQLYAAQRGINQMGSLDNGYQADPAVTAFLEASKQNPELADLMVLRAQLEYEKVTHNSNEGSLVPLDLTQANGVVDLLKKYGVVEPASGWSTLSASDINGLIATIDAKVTAKSQSLGVIGKTLESLLGASIFGFLPMIQRGAPLFDILHLRNAILEAGVTGTDPDKDFAIIKSNPQFIAQLGKWGALPYGLNSAEETKNALTLLDRAAVVNAETTRVTTNDVIYMRAPGAYDLEVKEAHDFLELMKPINDQINSLMGGDVSSLLNSTGLTGPAKQQVQDVVSGILGKSLLGAAINSSNSLVNSIQDAISGLVLSGSQDRLERIFAADAPDAVQDASTASRHRAYEGVKHKGPLSPLEKDIYEVITDIMNIEKGGYYVVNMDAQKKWEYGDYWGYPQLFELNCEKLATVLRESLPKINAAHVPEIYDFLRARPWLQDKIPYCKQLIKNEPLVMNEPRKLADNFDDKRPDNEEQVEMIQSAIRMLQKILANINGGTLTVDLSSLKSTLSETMGLTSNVTVSSGRVTTNAI